MLKAVNALAVVMVLAGTCIHIGALIPVRKLIGLLPPGTVRRRWYVMTGLIAFFIVGYLGYSVVFWNRHADWLDLIVPGVFLFGAGYVWLTANLSLQTANDVRRITLLEHESATDSLLGIYNRRYLDRRLIEEFARARRYSLPLSVLLLDIDNFKHVNDTYGHPVGDLVLKHLSGLIVQCLRDSDVATRYGGEEFMILAPNTPAPSAMVLAERLRIRIESSPLVVTGGPEKKLVLRITTSIGVAGTGEGATDSQALIKNADDALYRAKEKGRNRVVLSEKDTTERP